MKKTPKKYVGSSPMKFIDPMTAQVIIGAATSFFATAITNGGGVRF